MTYVPFPRKILYVEDDPILRTIVELGLERLGDHAVEVCEDGRSAVAAALAFVPNLVLLDVMMPEMDGPMTLEALRRQSPLRDTPVIFITAKIQPAEVQNYQKLGAAGVIAKPFDPLQLSERIQGIWNLWHETAAARLAHARA